ncbi:MAG TPA: Crp/Fnr family transcriptional regulator [Saprospiraceae bacterium]|mgnify:CR=1 FL=1|nr:Crp/Fnr family transcriptional regulator [Saprospiraceae bacterium]HMQ83264.1 Crp/Fnr family transcriptional regulator [Saprospiraceae bacterium]
MTIETTDILAILKKHFPNIAEKPLQEEIAAVGQVMHFRAGEVIMDFGSYIKLVPLIVKGSIRVSREDEHDGREIMLYFLGAGETCSMSFTCCMMNKKSVIRTEAVEDTTLIGIPIRYMDTWMSKYQSWKNFIMLSYDQKMVELVRVIDSIAFEDMDARLQKYLEARKASTGSPIINATHQEIANDLNASREAISRLLKKLEHAGVVELNRNQIKLLSN